MRAVPRSTRPMIHPDYWIKMPHGTFQGPIRGEEHTMPDGSVWFHPYNGWAPVRTKEQSLS